MQPIDKAEGTRNRVKQAKNTSQSWPLRFQLTVLLSDTVDGSSGNWFSYFDASAARLWVVIYEPSSGRQPPHKVLGTNLQSHRFCQLKLCNCNSMSNQLTFKWNLKMGGWVVTGWWLGMKWAHFSRTHTSHGQRAAADIRRCRLSGAQCAVRSSQFSGI